VVERVVEKSTVGLIYPMLTRTNYTEWSAVMHVNLQALVCGRWLNMEVWSTTMIGSHCSTVACHSGGDVG
jgi:hypothetical protein